MSTVATIHSETLPGAPPASRCQLVVLDGPDMGRAAAIGASLDVGTDGACGLVLSDDRVSARHLALTPDGAHFLARDLGSTNGTLYEGSIVRELRVPIGATLKIGRTFVRIQPQPQPLEVAPSQSRRFGDLVAESLVMREVFAVLELAAASDVTVLLEGETGTGKELAARAIHDASPRRRAPFVAIDCGALPETLLESELFGHVRGAFTGASTGRQGAFARADRGTLFLDELGAVSPQVQARLLRAVEERTIRPVGSDEERALDVRLLAASRLDLATRVAEGAFRPDLYYRLSVVRVTLPPLRARREDLPAIVAEMLGRRGLAAGRVAGPNLDKLVAHSWPGNVRELRNAVERALALTPGAASFAELKLSVSPVAGDEPLPMRSDLPYAEAKQALLHAFEHRYLRDCWERCEGNIAHIARESGIDRKHLRSLLKRQGLIGDTSDEE